ncbi:hypothetical protein [Enterovibrio nigricans]|uniref:Uncharacterized protein n=1 Tax=Enterovibrio nigricans DSM 22720 TaxID=1121868 RepID=A0A1T4UL38_9GAMM|nr:hypothetical protein [Enterovibrio nigricans]PKF49459.1 hypothetical protein AT251_18605 [Enterovibrio nigricans]SKA53394.1 hypothetical protein SAMN02745132_01958 [Enterovibrio nigricans DSM 22720]
MDELISNKKHEALDEREELCDEIDALMDLMHVEGELSEGAKIMMRRTLVKLANALDVRHQH